jgi:hypothetical protein
MTVHEEMCATIRASVQADGPCRQVQTLMKLAFNLRSNSVRSSSFTIPPDPSFWLEAWFLKITSTKSQRTS